MTFLKSYDIRMMEHVVEHALLWNMRYIERR